MPGEAHYAMNGSPRAVTAGEPAAAECPEPRLVFVTGASRSGTTMLTRVLGNHSEVLGLNELHYFGELCEPVSLTQPVPADDLQRLAARLFARQARGIWGEGPDELDRQRARGLVEGLAPAARTAAGVFAAALDALAHAAGKRLACEQTPRNIFYAARLLALDPQARVVHLVRDPRAVLASQRNRWRRKFLGGSNIPLSEVLRVWLNYHPATMARLWVKAQQTALSLEGHPRVLRVRFEDIVTQPQREIGRICEFLGIAFEPGMLEVPQVGSSNRHNREGEKGISGDVLDRWEQVLSKGEIAVCERITGGLMDRFGYVRRAGSRSGGLAMLGQWLSYPLHAAGVLAANPRRAWIQLSALRRSREA